MKVVGRVCAVCGKPGGTPITDARKHIGKHIGYAHPGKCAQTFMFAIEQIADLHAKLDEGAAEIERLQVLLTEALWYVGTYESEHASNRALDLHTRITAVLPAYKQ
jgi:hypothetical protein